MSVEITGMLICQITTNEKTGDPMTQKPLDGTPSPVAHRPEDCNRLLLAALEAGDIEASVLLYESGAILFTRSGKLLSGHKAIRDNNAGIIALKPTFHIEQIVTTINADGDIATTRMKARLEGCRADGGHVTSDLHTLEVLRKQSDGSWRYVIDDPFGSMRAQMDEARAA
jgi:ketosteroid isomerase-like protein